MNNKVVDSLGLLVLSLVIAVCFGFWVNSYWAGLFMFFAVNVFMAVLGILYAINKTLHAVALCLKEVALESIKSREGFSS